MMRRIGFYIVALVAFAFLLAPFGWLLLSSFMTNAEALSVPIHWWPQHPTLDNYVALLWPSGDTALAAGGAAAQFPRAVANSTIVAVSGVVINLVAGVPAAHALSRLKFRGSDALLLFYVGSRMIPGIALLVPFYLMFESVGILDTPVALIVIYVTITLPFSIWVLKNYFDALPIALEESAAIDGCGWWRIVTRVLVPIAKPGLIAAGIFAFMTSWGEFLFVSVLSTSAKSITVPLVAANLSTDISVQYTQMTAAGVLAVIVPLALAWVFQRHIVEGLSAGSTK
jgi:multiple sugar transport system permease protein